MFADSIADSALRRLEGSIQVAIDQFQPHLIHDHGIWQVCHHAVALACKSRRVPRVISPRGMLEPWALRHKRWKKWIAWFLYQRRDLCSAKCLHATADQELDQLRRLGLTQPAVVLPNGVPLPDAVLCREKTHADGIKHALFLSRLHPKKGLETLLAAWREVLPAGWVMHVVGSGTPEYERTLAAAVRRAGLTAQWAFEGPHHGSAKWKWLHDADLFILPSFSENFGIVVGEALASGTPVITTTGTPWAKLRSRRCGWWVEPTMHEIAGALREATGMSGVELADMGRRGAAWVRQEFAWEPLARSMAEVYRWAALGGPPPAGLRVSQL